MKTEFTEHAGCFEIELTPETVAEASALVRFAINYTQEIRSLNTTATTHGQIYSSVVIGKRKQDTSHVPKAL